MYIKTLAEKQLMNRQRRSKGYLDQMLSSGAYGFTKPEGKVTKRKGGRVKNK